jgi:predicted DNA-binding ribbon-helix-helix protein
MPGDRDPKLSVRFAPEGYRRLREIAEARSVSMSRCVRQLVDEAAADTPRRPRRHLTESELLEMLRERAEDGNVTAIRSLFEIERQRDPRKASLDALERMAEGRRQ